MSKKGDIKKDIRFRVYISFTAILLFGLAIFIKAIIIQYKDGDRLRAMAQKTHIDTQELPAERGNIYSEDGALLSATTPEFSFYIDFKVIDKDTFDFYKDTLAHKLAHLFKDKSPAAYLKSLEKGYGEGLRYWSLKKKTDYVSYKKLLDFPIFNKGKNRGGLIVESAFTRKNPYGILARRTIGIWRKNAPLIGLEERYNSVLAGTDGYRTIQKIGNVWIPIEDSEVDPVHGKDIVTTIDIDIQNIAENALLDVVSKYESAYGTAIVMEVSTGKIKALANLGKQKDGSYAEDFNYALIPSESGSTFKLFSLLAVLDDGYRKIDDKVNVGNGVMHFGRQRIRDDHSGMGTITLRDAFAYSSNVAFAYLVNTHYSSNPMKYIKRLQSLQLHKKTGIDLAGEIPSFIKTTESKLWNKASSLPMIAYGYESMITPLHTCMVYNAVANNGKLMKPYLVSAVKEYGQVVDSIEPTVLVKSIAKPSTIEQLKDALGAVVEKGTAKRIKSPYYNFGGKTGTAQVADKGITYRDGVKQGTFVGFFPLENPKYTICVLVRSKPFGTYYGATVGGPVFKTIADKLYATKVGGWSIPDSVKKEYDHQLVEKGLSETLSPIVSELNWMMKPQKAEGALVSVLKDKEGNKVVNEWVLQEKVIPDLKGLGLKDALSILENEGIQVIISGVGKVKDQSIAPGEKVIKGQKIHLILG